MQPAQLLPVQSPLLSKQLAASSRKTAVKDY